MSDCDYLYEPGGLWHKAREELLRPRGGVGLNIGPRDLAKVPRVLRPQRHEPDPEVYEFGESEEIYENR